MDHINQVKWSHVKDATGVACLGCMLSSITMEEKPQNLIPEPDHMVDQTDHGQHRELHHDIWKVSHAS